jgi:hypothetical protein
MIQSEGSRHLIALGVVALATLVQHAVTSEAGANRDDGPAAAFSTQLLLDFAAPSSIARRSLEASYGVQLLGSTLAVPAPSASGDSSLLPLQAAEPSGSAAPSSPSEMNRSDMRLLDRGLTMLSASGPENLRLRPGLLIDGHWPANRDSVGAPIILTSRHVGSLGSFGF